MQEIDFGVSPLRSQRDYNEKKARKDVDMMRDTGGSYKHKDLQKPSRLDKKKHTLSESDPDAKDNKKDPDLKLAKELVKLAKQLIADKLKKVKETGSTRNSLQNAKAMKEKGLELKELYFSINEDQQINNNPYYGGKGVEAVFTYPNGVFTHTFWGFNCGYYGEGSRGFHEFLLMFDVKVNDNKIFKPYFEPNQKINLKDLI